MPFNNQFPNVTVLPEGPPDEDESWFEENPVVTSVLIVSVLIAVAYAIYFWIRSRRKAKKRANDGSRGSDSQASRHPDAFIAQTDRPNEPFVILQNGKASVKGQSLSAKNTVRQERPKKQMLAVPPLFMVSQRKSAPSDLGTTEGPEQIPVGWARWSTAGVKKPESTMQNDDLARSQPSSDQNLPPPSGFVMQVPTKYRRISDADGNAMYVPEPAPAYLSVMATSSGLDKSKNAHPIEKS